jgi:hypothetical protein
VPLIQSQKSFTFLFWLETAKPGLIGACVEIVGLGEDNLNVEFTQHAGDEMFHPLYGGLSDDWNAGEPDRLG